MTEDFNSSSYVDSGTRSPEYLRNSNKGGRPAPFNRVFVLGDKRSTEKDYKAAFSKYGTVKDVQLMHNKTTHEHNGIAYITLSKTSEAALCVENLTGEVLAGAVRSLKVLFASERLGDGKSQSDSEINEQVCRLFLFVPKTLNESQLEDMFSKYGTITNLTILQDKVTRQSKGLAFITYSKASSAAKAYEECDATYRPKFAEPSRKRTREDDDRYRDPNAREPRNHDQRYRDDRYSSRDRERGRDYHERERSYGYRERERGSSRYSLDAPSASVAVSPTRGDPRTAAGVMDYLSTYPNNGVTTIIVKVPKGLNHSQVTKLFNLVPTLDSCELISNSYTVKDEARVTYSSPACAAYAHEVFSGFEYPPGCSLEVDFCQQPVVVDVGVINGRSRASESMYEPRAGPDHLSSTPRSGYADLTAPWNSRHDNNWLQALPRSQPLVDHATECLKRLFFVCSPTRLDHGTLENLFSRFGFLIHIDYLPGKACGFAKYANVECANKAQDTLHGKSLDGISLKVMEAQAPPEKLSKVESV